MVLSIEDLLLEIEKLKEENKKLRKRKKYGLVWDQEKEPEKVVLDCQRKLPILKEIKDNVIINNKDKPVNILIEGDNYHALQALNYTHKEKIDVIYIDPPYNTKNEGFIYNDKIVDINDNYRHSKWLNFISKRLELAKNLLSEEGTIFISIDNNEYAQLKLLCDKIFDEINFIGNFVWRKKVGAGADSKFLFTQHEYILFYAKDISKLTGFYEPLNDKQKKEYKNPDGDPRDLWAPTDLTAPSSDKDDSRLYEITSPNGKKWIKRWSYTKENMDELIANNLVWFGKDGNSMPKRKRFLSEKKGLVPRSWIDFVLTQDGKKDIENIFKKKDIFSYPKPVSLIKHFLRIASKKDSIVLDFFAGSGTTGQASLELNYEDDGNRKFILCNNNENNICRDVCYQRLFKTIHSFDSNDNLRYYKTEFIDVENIQKITDKKKIELTHNAGELIAIKEEVFDEIEKNDWWQIFKSKDKTVAIYFREDQSELDNLFKKLDDNSVLYLFSWGKNELKGEDYNKPNVKIKEIPQPIIEVYKEINKIY